MSFKTLHSFNVNITKEIEETSVRIEGGKEITIKEKVKKEVPVTLVLKDITRRERQDLNIWHGKNYNEAITVHGLSPRITLVQKFMKDPNNPLSQGDDKNLVKMYEAIEETKNEIIRLNAIGDLNDPVVIAKKDKLALDHYSLQKRIQDVETSYQTLFSYTAEYYAQNKSVTWLILNLTFIKTGENTYEPLFPGKDFLSKEDHMFALDDNKDELFNKSIERLTTFWGLVFLGKISKPEDFKIVEEEFAKQLQAEKELAERAAKIDQAVVAQTAENLAAETVKAEVEVNKPVEEVPVTAT